MKFSQTHSNGYHPPIPVGELGELEDALRDLPAATPIFLAVGDSIAVIAEVTGYRGVFCDLALKPVFPGPDPKSETMTASGLLRVLADLQEYGLRIPNVGDYGVGSMTELWISTWAIASNQIVTGGQLWDDGFLITSANYDPFG